MGDYGVCANNLDKLKEMHSEKPLTDRELKLFAMQFDYTSTACLDEDFQSHEMVRLLYDGGYLFDPSKLIPHNR